MLRPISPAEWNEPKAAHLLNRAGFGATLSEIVHAAGRPPEEVVEELVEFQQTPDEAAPPGWVGPDSERRQDRRLLRKMEPDMRREMAKERRQDENKKMVELREWWLNRMLRSSRPLQEKLTLFWHGHFATGFRKVKSAYAMYLQNETFRKHANGNWELLVTAVAQDPAMLVYLDNANSKAKAPNENFARELMELFTLGIGHYTEEDIREAARAFTGWSIDRDRVEFVHRPRQHDEGSKVFMGKKGNHDGNDVIRLILAQGRAAEFIAAKLWSFFAYPEPEPELTRNLAACLRDNRYQFRPLLKKIFMSRAFYSEKAYRTQIKSPVQYLVYNLRLLDLDMPRNPRAVQKALRVLGQDLFDPPNVKGWDGGYSWITTGSLLNRYRLADAMVKGVVSGGIAFRINTRVDTDTLLPAQYRKSRNSAREYLQRKLFHSSLRAEDTEAFNRYFAGQPPPDRWSPYEVKDAVSYMMKTPQYQLI